MNSPSRSQPMSATDLPKLVMGYIEVVSPDGEPGIPYDEALIHIDGDEDSEIEVRCPAALRIAPQIVEAVNSHTSLKARIEELTRALEFIAEGYENHDISHVNYRVKVYQVALAALEAKHD